MTEIDNLREFVKHHPNYRVGAMGTLAVSMTDLLAEVDALRAKVPTPPRRPRTYTCPATGAVFRWANGRVETHDGKEWRAAGGVSVYAVAGVADLLASPDEPAPVETVEDVLWSMNDDFVNGKTRSVTEYADRIRAHLSQQTPTLTAGEHIAALVAMGAKIAHYKTDERESSGAVLYFTVPSDATHRVLLLPPEVSP